jgi:hypothetical protein
MYAHTKSALHNNTLQNPTLDNVVHEKTKELLSAARPLSLSLGIGILLHRCLRSAHMLKLLLLLLLVRSNMPPFLLFLVLLL